MVTRRSYTQAGIADLKTTIPTSHVPLIRREPLLRSLDAAVTRPVALVCAPAGFGKTSLLADWATNGTSHRQGDVAWVSLDADDNDGFRLWTAILGALAQLSAVGEHCTLPRPAEAGQDIRPGFVATVANTLAELPRPVWLVLDDVHEVVDPGTRWGLRELMRYQPDQLHVVLSSRHDPHPDLALPRLRVEGRLGELDADALRITHEEARALLAQHGVTLAEDDLARLLERTEGWAAALRLAALSLRGHPDPSGFVAGFRGDNRPVADYLFAEIMTRLPAALQEFLMDTSVCQYLTADLADRLTGRTDAAEVLAGLRRSNILVTGLGADDRWLRYHSMLTDYLRTELARRRSARLPELHRRAAAWHTEQGLLPEALEHAVAAGDLDGAAGLLDRHGVSMVIAGQDAVLRRVLDGVPVDRLRHPPGALLAMAYACVHRADLETADRLLALDRKPEDQASREEVLRAVVELDRARLAGGLDRALRAAEPLLPDHLDDRDLEAAVRFSRGAARCWTGRRGPGTADLEAALALAGSGRRDRLAVECLSELASMAATGGDLVAMADRAEEALRYSVRHRAAPRLPCATAYAALAWVKVQRCRPDAAADLAGHAFAMAEGRSDPGVELWALAVLAMVRYDRGQRHAALDELHAALHRSDGRQVPPAVLAVVLAEAARTAWAVGDQEGTHHLTQLARRRLADAPDTGLLTAYLHLAQGRVAAARRSLRPLLDGSAVPLVATNAVGAALLEAQIAMEHGHHAPALAALRQAVVPAAPQELHRPFQVTGEPARELLSRYGPGLGPYRGFALRTLALFSQQAVRAPLTPREYALLEQLDTVQTLSQVAAALSVSVNTIKTQARGLYGKLGVGNRRDAVRAARAAGLLTVDGRPTGPTPPGKTPPGITPPGITPRG
ncbi:LuxR C-terminal-related transcriptional regulator [Streptomyces sp. Y1]|uniref:LuxR C-terminal-related transcriptional regulator n=1 Tax=Streptomyces sp. Y1 TaxID=3238634 RepID=A0AB39TUF7_9ACTN